MLSGFQPGGGREGGQPKTTPLEGGNKNFVKEKRATLFRRTSNLILLLPVIAHLILAVKEQIAVGKALSPLGGATQGPESPGGTAVKRSARHSVATGRGAAKLICNNTTT